MPGFWTTDKNEYPQSPNPTNTVDAMRAEPEVNGSEISTVFKN